VSERETDDLKATDLFPDPPRFSEEQLAECQSRGDFRPVFFEWYRFVGTLAVTMAHLKYESPIFAAIPRRNYHVLAGSINRLARLMIANVALSHEGSFGEATDILHRCVFETATKAIWMASANSDERIQRYLASSVQGDLELRSHINKAVESRKGEPTSIEQRMLQSIQRTVESTELNESEISTTPALPDLAAIMSSLGWSRLMYVVAQKMGSHHVHGTWTSLTTHYLQRVDGAFVPSGGSSATRTQHYAFTCLVVLSALQSYAEYVITEGPEQDALVSLFRDVRDEVQASFKSLVGDEPTI